MSKKNKKRNPYPDQVRKEAVRAYFAGKSSSDAASIACMNTGWKGDVPDPSSVRGWAAAAKGDVHAAEKKVYYPKGLQRDVVTAYKAGATIEDAIEAACDEWQWGSNYPDSATAESWIKEAGVQIRTEDYPENLRLETLNCYWANKNASLAARQASELVGWTGDVPSFRTVTGWIWEAEQALANAPNDTYTVVDDSQVPSTPQEDVSTQEDGDRGGESRANKNRVTKGKDPILDWVLNMGGSPQDAAAIAAWRGPSEPQVRVVDSLEAAVELVAKQAGDGEDQASAERADEFASAMTGHMLDSLDVNEPKARVRRTHKQILDAMEKRLEYLRDRKRISDLMGAVHDVADENKKEYRKLVKHLRAMIVAQGAFGADSLELEAKSAFEMREKICVKLEALLKSSATIIRESSGSVYVYPEKFRQEVVKKYEEGANSTRAVALVKSQPEWSGIRRPDKTTVLRWVRSAGVQIRSGRRGLFGKELTAVSGQAGVYVYPESFRNEVVKEYESGAGAVKAASLVGARAKWASVRDPDRATVLRWVRAAGIEVRSFGGSDVKYSCTFKEEAIKAYVDGASAAGAVSLAIERTGWTGRRPSNTTMLGWVRGSGNNVRGQLYPDTFKEEAIKAYVSGASAYLAVSLAIERTKWTGKRPSNTAMLGWVRESGNKVRNRGEAK